MYLNTIHAHVTTVQYLTGLWIQSNKHLRRQVGVSSSGACILHAVSCNIVGLIVGWHMNICLAAPWSTLTRRTTFQWFMQDSLAQDGWPFLRQRYTLTSWASTGPNLTTPSSDYISVCWRSTVHMKHWPNVLLHRHYGSLSWWTRTDAQV